MQRLNIYEVVDKQFIESSDNESGKSDFDDEYYSCKPPLSDDYLSKSIEVVKPNQFSADRENISMTNYEMKLLEDLFNATDNYENKFLKDFFDSRDEPVMEFRPSEITDGKHIWPAEFIKFVESNAKKNVREEEVHDSKTDSSSALFRATTFLQEEIRTKNNQTEVCTAKEQQKKLLFVGFILLIFICVCIMFVFIYNQSFWLHSKINLIKCGFLCDPEEL